MRGRMRVRMMLNAVRMMTLEPDLRVAGMIRAEHALRAMGAAGVAAAREAGVPDNAIRHALERRRWDRSPAGFGLMLDGSDLSFTAFAVSIGAVRDVPVRSGAPLPDGMECARAFLYVGDDELPRLSLYPPVRTHTHGL